MLRWKDGEPPGKQRALCQHLEARNCGCATIFITTSPAVVAKRKINAREGALALSGARGAEAAGDESTAVANHKSISADAEQFWAIFDRQNAGRTAEGS